MSAYLVTKAIGAGALLVAALYVLLGHAGAGVVGVLGAARGRLHGVTDACCWSPT